ncbi:MAG: class I SAM-dependent methyltransferase [Ruminococcus sp.]|nr:class I SAM-dependent methyltransferase [Ruminococcus sp.]
MKSFWDKVAGVYDIMELVNRSAARRMERITEENISPGDIVLDCASGTGMLTFAAAKKARKVLSSDLSGEMVRTAAKKARFRGVSNVRFAVRDICELKVRDGAFDKVIAGNVLHLLPDPAKAAHELVRVTKKGGNTNPR